MRLPRVRLTIRVLMVVVAVAAVPMAFWDAWFDTPVRRWQRAIIDDRNESGRRQALMECRNGIGTIDTETALPTLLDALRSPSFRVRETAVMGLAEVGRTERDAVPPLIEALADPEPLVRVAAARAMATVLAPGHTGRDRGVPALRRLLVDSSPLVRLQAACTLVLLGHGGDALPVLIEALREPDYHAQSAALWFLGNMGPPAARVALPEVKALESRLETLVAPGMVRLLRVHAAFARRRLGELSAGLATLRALEEGSDIDLAREARLYLSYIP